MQWTGEKSLQPNLKEEKKKSMNCYQANQIRISSREQGLEVFIF
jgi:hypothetical protein